MKETILHFIGMGIGILIIGCCYANITKVNNFIERWNNKHTSKLLINLSILIVMCSFFANGIAVEKNSFWFTIGILVIPFALFQVFISNWIGVLLCFLLFAVFMGSPWLNIWSCIISSFLVLSFEAYRQYSSRMNHKLNT